MTTALKFYHDSYSKLFREDLLNPFQTLSDFKNNIEQEGEHLVDWRADGYPCKMPQEAIVGALSIISRVGALLALIYACRHTGSALFSPAFSGRKLLYGVICALTVPLLREFGEMTRGFAFGDKLGLVCSGGGGVCDPGNLLSWHQSHTLSAIRRIGPREYLKKTIDYEVLYTRKDTKSPFRQARVDLVEAIAYRSTIRSRAERPTYHGNGQVWKNYQLLSAEEAEKNTPVFSKIKRFIPLPSHVTPELIRENFDHLR